MRILVTHAEALVRGLSSERVEIVKLAGSLARQRGERCFLAGGAVRDLFLGRPLKELDLVVEGNGLVLAERLAVVFEGSIRRHDRFATAHVELRCGDVLDVATTRTERYPFPGSLPEIIVGGTIEEDLLRRDFTINALALSLDPSCFGMLRDPRGGVRDLRSGWIRILHDGSFRDDPSRALRAARLAERLAFRIEPKTRMALEASMSGGAMGTLSGTRLHRELELLAGECGLRRSLAILRDNGLLEAVFPQLGPLGPSEDAVELAGRIDRLLSEPCAGEASGTPPLVPLLLMCLVPENRTGQAVAIGDRLGLTGRQRAAAIDLRAAARELVERVLGAGPSRSGIYFALEGSQSEEVLAAQALRPGVRPAVSLYRTELASIRGEVGGEDLARLGLPAGSAFGAILRKLMAARLDGAVKTRSDEMDLARSLVEERLRGGS